MGGKGGGDGGSDKIIEEQKKQAEEARKKEEERKARIQQGMGSIKNAFEGAPVMATKSQAFDWSKFAPPTAAARLALGGTNPASAGSGIPAGWTAVQVADPNYRPSAIAGIQRGSMVQAPAVRQPNAAGFYDNRDPARVAAKAASRQTGHMENVGSQKLLGNPDNKDAWAMVYDTPRAAAVDPNAGKIWALRDAQGNLHYQGQGFNYDTQVDTGARTGGFDDAFYDKYKQGILDYYTPQVADQYGDAKDELTYRLARAGTLRSSVAANEVADLSKQNDLNRAQVLNKADQGAADLRSNVAAERAKVEGQLLASEDPNAAASQALAAVKNISLDQPEMSPLGMIFNVGTIGAANALRGYQAKTAYNTFSGSNPSGAQRVIR